jgi:3'-5' exonuclease
MSNYKQKFYFDIETFRSENPPSREEVQVPGNYKKPESIEQYINENIEDIWNKTALNSLKGQIICIGYAFDDEPEQVLTGTEEQIIKDLEKVLMSRNMMTEFIGHNIMGFDIPFIYHRAIKYKTKNLRNILPKSRYDKNVLDTMTLFAGTDWQAKWSLKNIANYLGIDNSKDEIDGSMVGQLWLAGEKEKIYDYCKEDVRVLRQIYYKIEF